MAQKFSQFFIIFLIGLLAAVFNEVIFSPLFVKKNFFFKQDQPLRIIERKETIIQEKPDLKEAVKKVQKTVIAINTNLGGNTFSGSGLILTADGLVITLADLVPKSGNFSFSADSKILKAEILKRDLKENLALAKIEGNNFLVPNFLDQKISLGEKIFVLSSFFEDNKNNLEVQEGIISKIKEDSFETNLLVEKKLAGSPVFDFNGKVVGLAKITKNGKLEIMPLQKIKNFAGF